MEIKYYLPQQGPVDTGFLRPPAYAVSDRTVAHGFHKHTTKPRLLQKHCKARGCRENHDCHYCRNCGSVNSDHRAGACPKVQQQQHAQRHQRSHQMVTKLMRCSNVQNVFMMVLFWIDGVLSVLCGVRNVNDRHRGVLTTFGGRCNRDEPPFNAAIRETKEEGGVDISAEDKYAEHTMACGNMGFLCIASPGTRVNGPEPKYVHEINYPRAEHIVLNTLGPNVQVAWRNTQGHPRLWFVQLNHLLSRMTDPSVQHSFLGKNVSVFYRKLLELLKRTRSR